MIGQTLGHYRIIEKIGAGGMGAVYRAHDDHLDREVAVKVLAVNTLTDKAAHDRFRREALALSRLSHPNVATVFDFDTKQDVDFLAMELILGSPLSCILATGPLDEAGVLKLGMQLADGLAAAHAHGVLHRDLKPRNLIVTPDGRLKILDFGLATLLKPVSEMELTRSSTETPAYSGTLPYMAPEQLRGEPADERSDIFAAGTVLYEMATGHRSFPQSQSAELIGAILHQTPARPSAHNRLIGPALDGVVMKALEKAPAQRYQTARELLAALEAAGGLIREKVRARRAISPGLRWALASLVAVVVIVGVIFGLNVGHLRDRLRPASPAGSLSFLPRPSKPRRSVAVLGFKNVSGRPDELWLSTALSEMLTTELAAGEQLRLVSGENVAQMKMNLALPEEGTYSKATLNRIRKNVGTDDVVVGSYLALGNGQVRVDLRLQDAASGETLASVADSGKEDEVPDLAARVGEKLREKLGAGSVTTAEAGVVLASLPSNPEAARLYSAGLARLRVFDALGARDLLEKAVTVDPAYAPAHSALAGAWSTLGYDARAKDEAKKAFDLSANLSREDRLMVEGRYRETVSEWDKAAEIYRTLWGFFPDNLDYGLRLAGVQTSASRGQQALDTIDQLRKLPGPAPEDPRIDIAEAEAANSIGDFDHDAAAAAKAAEKGRALGARLLVARAQRLRCWALHKLGQPQESAVCCEESKRMFTEAGDRDGIASVLVTTAAVLQEQGELARAQSRYEEALVIQRGTGDMGGVAVILNNLGNVYLGRGNYAVAKKMYEESVSISREIGDEDGVVLALGNLAGLLTDEGDDLPRTLGMFEELLTICRQMGSKDRTALQLGNIGTILYWQGDLPGAERALGEALTLASQSGEKRQLGYYLASLADVHQAEGNLAEARSKREQALKLRNELGDQGDAAETRIALADQSIEEGHPKEAEMSLRQVIPEMRALKLMDEEAWAYPVLARALLAAGESAEARKAIDSGASLAAKSHSRVIRFAFAIAEARVLAATARPAEATEGLRATMAEARKYGFVGYEFEARLALGETELKSDDTGAGRALLYALEKDATAKRFLLIARKARIAAGP